MKFSTLVGAALAAGAVAHPNIYLIRHAEKNEDGTISAKGMKREQCLINVFGRHGQYNIQKIIVQNPYPGGMHFHPIRLGSPRNNTHKY